jgi:hypothetical protein
LEATLSADELTAPQVFEGWFWLPDEDRSAYGRLEHDLRDGPRLHPVGEGFVSYSNGAPHSLPQVTTIYGQQAGGPLLTVLGFERMASAMPLGDPHGVVIDGVADRVIVGVNVPSADALTSSLFVCSLFGLREFSIGTDHQRGFLERPGEEEHSQPLQVDLGNGCHLMLTAFRRRDGRVVDLRTQVLVSAQFEVSPARSLPEIERDAVGPLRDLVTFATLRQSYVTELSAQLEQAPGSAKSLSAADPRPTGSQDVLSVALNLGNHDDPAGVIRGWYDLRRRVGPVWEIFFDRGRLPIEDRFLPIVSFAEGYHRATRGECPPLKAEEHDAAVARMRNAAGTEWGVYEGPLAHANSRSQRRRLRDLVDQALRVLSDWALDAREFCSQVVDTRNWLIHWGEKGQHAVEDPIGRALLVQRLIVVLYVNLTLDLGFNDADAARVIANGWPRLP